MYTIVLYGVGPTQAIDMKNALIEGGLILNVDFSWRYIPIESYGFDYEPKRVEFDFEKLSMATFYKIKWAEYVK